MKRVKVFDNNGDSLDRYTIIFLARECFANDYYYVDISASKRGTGFYQHGEFSLKTFNEFKKDNFSHLGKQISFSKLSKELQAKINQER